MSKEMRDAIRQAIRHGLSLQFVRFRFDVSDEVFEREVLSIEIDERMGADIPYDEYVDLQRQWQEDVL